MSISVVVVVIVNAIVYCCCCCWFFAVGLPLNAKCPFPTTISDTKRIGGFASNGISEKSEGEGSATLPL